MGEDGDGYERSGQRRSDQQLFVLFSIQQFGRPFFSIHASLQCVQYVRALSSCWGRGRSVPDIIGCGPNGKLAGGQSRSLPCMTPGTTQTLQPPQNLEHHFESYMIYGPYQAPLLLFDSSKSKDDALLRVSRPQTGGVCSPQTDEQCQNNKNEYPDGSEPPAHPRVVEAQHRCVSGQGSCPDLPSAPDCSNVRWGRSQPWPPLRGRIFFM